MVLEITWGEQTLVFPEDQIHKFVKIIHDAEIIGADVVSITFAPGGDNDENSEVPSTTPPEDWQG